MKGLEEKKGRGPAVSVFDGLFSACCRRTARRCRCKQHGGAEGGPCSSNIVPRGVLLQLLSVYEPKPDSSYHVTLARGKVVASTVDAFLLAAVDAFLPVTVAVDARATLALPAPAAAAAGAAPNSVSSMLQSKVVALGGGNSKPYALNPRR